jgi:signal peptidase I
MKTFKKYKNPLVFTIFVLLTINIFFYNYKITWNYGVSMEPSYENGDFLVVERMRSLGKDWRPDRYDHIIVSTTAWETLSKRVIGLSGEHVNIMHGKIWINGKEHKCPFGEGDIIWYQEAEEIRASKPKEEWLFLNSYVDIGLIPKGSVFVIGDNRNVSWYGVVKVKDIKGLVIL